MKRRLIRLLPILMVAVMMLSSGCDKISVNDETTDGTVASITSEENVSEESATETEESKFKFKKWEDDYMFFKSEARRLASEGEYRFGYSGMVPELERYVLVTLKSDEELVAYRNNEGVLEEYALDDIERYRNILLTPELFEDFPVMTDFDEVFTTTGGCIDEEEYLGTLNDGEYHGRIVALSPDMKYAYVLFLDHLEYYMSKEDFDNLQVGDTVTLDADHEYEINEIDTEVQTIYFNGNRTAQYDEANNKTMRLYLFGRSDTPLFVKVPLSDNLVCDVSVYETYLSEEATLYDSNTLHDLLEMDIINMKYGVDSFQEGGYRVDLSVDSFVIENGECTYFDVIIYERIS